MALKVLSVTEVPDKQDVYDLSISNHHNFVVGAVNVHNSANPRL